MPTVALNHWRSSSMKVTAATGVPQICAASWAMSSKPASGSVSRMPYADRVARRSASLIAGRGPAGDEAVAICPGASGSRPGFLRAGGRR